MSKFFIKIDRSSIRYNPNEGNTTYVEKHRPTITAQVQHPVALDPPQKGIYLTRIWFQGKYRTPVEMNICVDTHETASEFAEWLKSQDVDPNYILITFKCNDQVFHSINPEPKYFYDYEPTDVKCCKCKKKFARTELQEDSWESDDDYSSTTTKCPKCGYWNCCELEFEKFAESMVDKTFNDYIGKN